jgi:hypothetical protein
LTVQKGSKEVFLFPLFFFDQLFRIRNALIVSILNGSQNSPSGTAGLPSKCKKTQ